MIKNNIERLEDIAVRSVAKKSSNKVYIIQSLDKQLTLEDIARSRKMTIPELLTEMEAVVDSGTKVSLDHIINKMMDEDELDEIHSYMRQTEDVSFNELREEFDEDEFSDEEVRLLRINFISNMGN